MTTTTCKAQEADPSPAAMPVLSPRMIFLFSLTSALAVANVYSAQPLLELIATSLQVSPGTIGTVVTVTQTGYALGLLFLVPLGDCINRKKLVLTQLVLSVLALTAAAFAPDLMTLLCAMLLVGLMAVVTQLMVAWAAMLASPTQRGQVVGSVTSGIVIGILLARFISGMIAGLAGGLSDGRLPVTADLAGTGASAARHNRPAAAHPLHSAVTVGFSAVPDGTAVAQARHPRAADFCGLQYALVFDGTAADGPVADSHRDWDVRTGGSGRAAGGLQSRRMG